MWVIKIDIEIYLYIEVVIFYSICHYLERELYLPTWLDGI